MLAVDQDQVVVVDLRERFVRADHHRQAQLRARIALCDSELPAVGDDAEHAVFGQLHQLRRRDAYRRRGSADARGELAFLGAGFARRARPARGRSRDRCLRLRLRRYGSSIASNTAARRSRCIFSAALAR